MCENGHLDRREHVLLLGPLVEHVAVVVGRVRVVRLGVGEQVEAVLLVGRADQQRVGVAWAWERAVGVGGTNRAGTHFAAATGCPTPPARPS